MSAFTGFPKGAVAFLRGLQKNNTKAWFDQHREEYDAHLIEPAKAFVTAIGPSLLALAPKVVVEPRINRTIKRINRDTRFSKDKSPYKDHLDVHFWEGKDKNAASGFFLRLMPDRLYLVVGIYDFGDRLKKYRAVVGDPKQAAALAKAVAQARKAGFELGGATYKKTPRGMDPDAKHAGLFLHSGVYCHAEHELPRELHTAAFVPYCLKQFKAAAPLQRWLADQVAG